MDFSIKQSGVSRKDSTSLISSRLADDVRPEVMAVQRQRLLGGPLGRREAGKPEDGWVEVDLFGRIGASLHYYGFSRIAPDLWRASVALFLEKTM